MPYLTSFDDSTLYYEEHGDSTRPALLLLPGLLGSIGVQWRPLLPALAHDYRVVITDLRGHGRSHNAADTLRIADMAGDIALLLDSLGIDAVHIGGYSLGGYIGLLLHLQQPGRVHTLLMHGTKFYWSDATVATMKKQLNPEAIRAKVPAYAAQLASEHGEDRWESLLHQAAGMVQTMPATGIRDDEAAKATCPVLVGVGDRDELIPVEEALQLSRAVPPARLLVLPGVRHPFPSIPPSLLLEAMRLFHRE